MANLLTATNRLLSFDLTTYQREQEEFPTLSVVKGTDYDYYIQVIVSNLDTDGAVELADIGDADRIEFNFSCPGEQYTRLTSLVTDGSDGKAIYKVEHRDFGIPGIWQLTVVLQYSDAPVTLPSVQFIVE